MKERVSLKRERERGIMMMMSNWMRIYMKLLWTPSKWLPGNQLLCLCLLFSLNDDKRCGWGCGCGWEREREDEKIEEIRRVLVDDVGVVVVMLLTIIRVFLLSFQWIRSKKCFVFLSEQDQRRKFFDLDYNDDTIKKKQTSKKQCELVGCCQSFYHVDLLNLRNQREKKSH